VLNGIFNQITNDNDGYQEGLTSFNVTAGDSFGFQINTVDNYQGRASATISNFNGPTGDPTVVPTPALIPGLIGMGVAAWRKRQAEAEAGVTEEV